MLGRVWSCLVMYDHHVCSWSGMVRFEHVQSSAGKIGNIMNFSPRGNIGNMGSLEIIGKIRIKWKIWNIGKMGGKDYVYGK